MANPKINTCLDLEFTQFEMRQLLSAIVIYYGILDDKLNALRPAFEDDEDSSDAKAEDTFLALQEDWTNTKFALEWLEDEAAKNSDLTLAMHYENTGHLLEALKYTNSVNLYKKISAPAMAIYGEDIIKNFSAGEW